jgi:hypothetical protein
MDFVNKLTGGGNSNSNRNDNDNYNNNRNDNDNYGSNNRNDNDSYGSNNRNDNDNYNSSEQRGSSSGQKQEGSGGFLGGLGDKFNSAAGGGRESEKNEDYVDKGMFMIQLRQYMSHTNIILGVDFVQEKFMGAGPQDNEV